MLKKLYKLVREDSTPPAQLRMVISGMPRGGTSFMANLLSPHCPTGHEHIFGNCRLNDPPLGRCKEIEVSGFAFPWAHILKRHGIKLVQLIRNPLKNCTSFYNYFNAGKQHVSWEDTCEMYFVAHAFLEPRADAIVHLERWQDEIDGTLELLPDILWGELIPPEIFSPSSWSEPRRKWEELPEKVQELGRKHGYGPE